MQHTHIAVILATDQYDLDSMPGVLCRAIHDLYTCKLESIVVQSRMSPHGRTDGRTTRKYKAFGPMYWIDGGIEMNVVAGSKDRVIK